jgi:hypothetical protein
MEKGKKLNCWEFKECGREAEGKNVSEHGVCPAFNEQIANDIHDGKNAGRCCWVIAGTLCEGEKQGTFAQKFDLCQQCDFYALVKEEEHPSFKLSISIINEINKRKAEK